MIRRVHDAEALNRIVNRADVKQMMFLGMTYPNQELDLSAWADDPRNICLVSDGFGAMFVFRGPAIYECHIMVEQAARGMSAFVTGRAMLDYMRAAGAALIWGQPSVYNRAAICYIRRMGLKPCGFGNDVAAGEVQYFVMEL